MELNTPITYTENTTLTIEQSGTYQIEVFGASGNGGNGKSYNKIVFGDSTYKISASGGGGGGGGYACSKVKMNKNDTIVLSPGAIGQISTAIINSTVKDYWPLKVTHGKNGSSTSGDGPIFSTTIGGAGGTASGGNQDNANGNRGGMGEQGTGIATPGSGGAPGNLNGNKGGNGGSGQISTEGVGTHEGESGKPGFIIVTLLLVDPDSGSDEGETPTDPETPPSGGGTTEPEIPPGGEEPETPSQPSTAILNILTASSIKELKKRVNQEISRRKYYGNISSAAPSYNTPNNETVAQASEINNNIINKLNLINIKLTQENINDPIKYSYINDQLTTFEGNSNSNTGCRQACTGFCSTLCGDSCGSGCGEKCTGCGATARGYISVPCSTCSGTCNATSSGGSSGCGDCYGDCDGTCTTGQTSRNEDGTCTCAGNCKNGCYTGCKNACGSCSGTCSGSCSATGENSTGSTNSSCDCGGGCKSNCSNQCSGACSNECSGGCSTSSTIT